MPSPEAEASDEPTTVDDAVRPPGGDPAYVKTRDRLRPEIDLTAGSFQPDV